MTEFWFITTTAVTLAMVLVAFKLGRVYLVGMVAVCLVLSNVIGPKIVSVFGFAITAGTPVFAALPLGTDLLAERYGPRAARSAIFCAFSGMALFILISRPVSLMAGLPFVEVQAGAVDTIMSESLRLMVASPVAYLVWQLVDVAIFSEIRDRTGDRLLWLRNNVSTVVAQAGSTITFFAAAFGGTDTPWLEIALVSIGFYWVIALADTAIVYAAKHVQPMELFGG